MELVKDDANETLLAPVCKSFVLVEQRSWPPSRSGSVQQPVATWPGLVRRLAGRWLRRLGLTRPPHRSYPKWIKQRVRARQAEYRARVQRGLFSILTPVFDPPVQCLRELGRSILRQDYPEFEWIIVDNGSKNSKVRLLLERLSRERQVRLFRLPENEGIVRGTRKALEHATGKYVLPVDHDDRLYPDALRIVASSLQTHGDNAISYSDEDKLAHGKPAHPLSVIDRKLALELGAYTDLEAEGCPDWDLYCRFVRAGHVPRHIPEILYSWRMHERSTASPNSYAKPYTLECQRRVLTEHLRLLGVDDRFEIRPNLLYGEAGVWHPVRKPVQPPTLHVLVLEPPGAVPNPMLLAALAEAGYPAMEVQSSGSLREVERHCRENLDGDALVAVLAGELVPVNLDWCWEAVGLFDLYADTAVVGGRVLDPQGTVVSAGEVVGMNGLIGSPDAGRHESERGMPFICQHATDAVSPEFFLTRAGLLVEALGERDGMVTQSLLHAWLGAAARRRGQRVLYSPHIVARRITSPGPQTYSEQERLDFLQRHGELLADTRHYSRFLSRRPRRGYRLAAHGERDGVLGKLRSLTRN
jgi:hypothetical protein